MSAPNALTDLIAAYREAQRFFQADETDSEMAWEAFQRAEEAVIAFPCRSIDDVRAKAAFVISDAAMLDTVKECTVVSGGEYAIMLFLRSLLGETT